MKVTLAALLVCSVTSFSSAQEPAAQTPQQRVAMLKQWLQASQMQLRNYEWVETTIMLKDGEEKSRKVSQVYYDVDGNQQKVPAPSGSEQESGGPPGLLPMGRIAKRQAKRKQEELKEYLQSATALVHSYVPPDANRIQQAQAAGKMSISMIDPGRVHRLEFRDYLKGGDVLGIDIEIQTNRLLGIHVSSHLDEDPVQLDVAMGVLQDGTIYTAGTTLVAEAKGITVTVENTGYRRMGS